jgi:hypothetical protein
MQALTMDGVRRFMQTASLMQAVLHEAAVAVRRDVTPPVEPARQDEP